MIHPNSVTLQFAPLVFVSSGGCGAQMAQALQAAHLGTGLYNTCELIHKWICVTPCAQANAVPKPPLFAERNVNINALMLHVMSSTRILSFQADAVPNRPKPASKLRTACKIYTVTLKMNTSAFAHSSVCLIPCAQADAVHKPSLFAERNVNINAPILLTNLLHSYFVFSGGCGAQATQACLQAAHCPQVLERPPAHDCHLGDDARVCDLHAVHAARACQAVSVSVSS